MNGLYDGSCPVCGGHIYGAIGENGKHTPWKCRQCGATEDNPVFDDNKEIPWSVICYESRSCADYRTKKCFDCEKCADVEFPWSVFINGKCVNIEDDIINGITYRQLAERGNIEVVFMSYIAETRIKYDGEKWQIKYSFD